MTAHFADIPPVEGGSARPLWSVLIPTYNSGKYLEEALSSVLLQAAGADEMEIIVVDDCSTKDDPETVVNRLAGPRVRFIRQIANKGKVRNYETGLLASRGKLVHQLHGDDKVHPGFYGAMQNAFEKFPEAGAFFCESRYISEDGRDLGRTGLERPEMGLLDNWLEKIATSQRIQAPSMVVRRDVYETVGAFDRRLDMVEDWEMWIRIASRFQVGFVPELLADYRLSGSGTSANAVRTGAVANHIRALIRIVDQYLPRDVVMRVRTHRDREVAQYLTQMVPQLIRDKQYRAVARAYLDASRFSVHPKALYRLGYFSIRYRNFLKDR